ncbi:MAG: HAD family hydrolase [SAR202 cluster bacterium]|nr:HAD family hydrolase [SAR202 cluster bacterium]|tara:strand:+ start:1348 stop:2073 length:726 start_codon:yes stop_codon:yes gene_type:complete
MKIDTIVFDYGHTLIDLAPFETILEPYQKGISEILKLAHPNRSDHMEIAHRIVLYMEETINRSYNENRQEDELILGEIVQSALSTEEVNLSHSDCERIVEMDHQLHGTLSTVPSTTLETLIKLKTNGFRLGVMSNTVFVKKWIHLLPILNSSNLLDAVVFSSDIGVRKPNHLTYETILNELKAQKEQALFVGDRIIEDIRGPQNFGFAATALTHEFREEIDEKNEADIILTQLSEIVSFVR